MRGGVPLTHIILDILILLLLAFFVWKGYRKGFILGLAGILTIFFGILGGNIISNAYYQSAATSIAPFLDWVTGDAAEEAARNEGFTQTEEELAEDIFILLGISPKEVPKLVAASLQQAEETGLSVKNTVSIIFIQAITKIVLFLFAFILVCLLFSLIFHFISMIFNLPGLNLLDKFGGMALGLLYGMLICFVAGYVLRFAGIVIAPDITENSLFLRFFINVNPVTWFV